MSGSTAFVLQGGGSLSAPQAGALKALTDAGITPI
jgi:predicted acylesterase/phospholipase RssA